MPRPICDYIHQTATSAAADGNRHQKGDPTTLTHFVIAVLPSWWMRLRFRPKGSFLVLTPEGDPLPRELNPGQRWTGAAIQDDELNKLIDGGNVYAGVYHALRPPSAGAC